MGSTNLRLCLCTASTTPTLAARATFLANVRLNGSSNWLALVFGCMLPNGSRLSCGDSVAGERLGDEVRAPPGAQHSASLRAIIARQLQALVRHPRLEARWTTTVTQLRP